MSLHFIFPTQTDEVRISLVRNLRGFRKKNSGLKCSKDFYVAYSPEREDPGNKNFNTSQITKVVGAECDTALELAVEMYKTSINKVVTVSDSKTAEAVKL